MAPNAHIADLNFEALPPRVPEATRVYAIGDIHGRADLLHAMQAMILADSVGGPRRQVVVYLGDYIDRGQDSFGVIDTLVNAPLPGFESVHLRGNHEDFLLSFVETGEQGENWFFNGGITTMKSYGVTAKGAAGRNTAILRENLIDAMPANHLSFFKGLTLTHTEGDYLFVHAGIRPGVPLSHQKPEDLMWIRTPFLHAEGGFGHVVVHGHTPDFEPVVRENRIGVDTLAYRSGCLTCLVLEGEHRRFLQT